MTTTEKSAHTVRGWLMVAVIFIGLPVAAMMWLWRDRCVETVLSQLPAAGGAILVETFEKDCGPAMKPATMVRVGRKADGRLADDETVLLLHGRVAVEATWRTDESTGESLELSVPRDTVVVKMLPSWQSVKIQLKRL